ncbi:MAG: ASPIC/UnbV domain-containing protein, partial [Chloroflexi bacterium]|nr:ASPIC/UnbV domain-containing protein [Chloroflexota bacterium]
DGCLDVVVGNFGQAGRLFRNECASGNHWLRVNLRGNASGTDGLGAKIEVTVGGKTQVRRIVSGTSFMGQNMMDAHFGVGEADEIDSVKVYWPSGEDEGRTGVGVDQKITFEEP